MQVKTDRPLGETLERAAACSGSATLILEARQWRRECEPGQQPNLEKSVVLPEAFKKHFAISSLNGKLNEKMEQLRDHYAVAMRNQQRRLIKGLAAAFYVAGVSLAAMAVIRF